MKSFCIKTNQLSVLHYLRTEFEQINLPQVYLSEHTFKIYHNLILHYTGDTPSLFYEKISKILSVCILFFFEKQLISQLIDYNYFYFDTEEKEEILENCIELFDLENENTYLRYQYVHSAVYPYCSEHKSMILDGFIQFRLFDYRKLLSTTIDMAVNQFIIDREYKEFIEVLRLYIDTKTKKDAPQIHLVYRSDHSFLMDDARTIISTDESLPSVHYLSDISFSSNDYILNTLLSLLPSKLTIHLISTYPDDFIHTLQLLFESRVQICEDCNLCHLYRHHPTLQDGETLS